MKRLLPSLLMTLCLGLLTFFQGSSQCTSPSVTSFTPSLWDQCPGSSVSFTVAATGTDLTYKWKKNDVEITGAPNAPTFTIPSISAADEGNYKVEVSNSCGFSTTGTSYLDVVPEAEMGIVSSTIACAGSELYLSPGHSSTPSGATYQWYKDGSPISGGTSWSYRKTATTADDGNYQLIITHMCGTLTSNIAPVKVAATAPNITTQPLSQTKCVGGTATFSVVADNASAYQWYKGSTAITGATSDTYTTPALTTAEDNTTYSVQVSNGCGSTNSATATLKVSSATPVITGHPVSASKCVGSSVGFYSTSTGDYLSFQWLKDGSPISGATSAFYVISSVTAGDAGDYEIAITNSCGTVNSTKATLTIPTAAPTIATEPLPVTTCVGSAVSFNVVATGTGLTYQWYKGSTAIGSANADTYTISAVTAGDADDYSVQITDGCNTITSVPAALTVHPAPAITTQPTPQTVCAGSSATFSVVASGTGLSYQWRKDGMNITSATADTYTIPAATVAEAGLYDVVVSGSCAPAQTSAAVNLTVNSGPAINTHPVAVIVCAGGSATFTVAATGSGLNYQWHRGTTAVGTNSDTYTIPTVATGDADNYSVEVTDACGFTTTSSTAALTINAVTAITTQPVGSTICEGGNLTLTVAASGTGSLTYEWRKGGSPISGATSATFTVPTSTMTEAGDYEVVVTGSCGSVTSAMATVVVNPVTVITTQPADQTVCEGSAATFKVVATGTGTLGYQWKKNGVAILGEIADTYTIPAVAAADADDYTVDVTGACGTVTSAVARLTVNTIPAISANPASQTICPGTGVSFTVTASGIGNTYQWKKDGLPIGSAIAATYSITSASPADAATYTVDVTNSCGSVTSLPASLSINVITAITAQPAATAVCEGGTATFSVTAMGSNLSYQWRKEGSPIAGADKATLNVAGVTAANVGSYDVVITGDCGTATSSSVNLSLNIPVSITSQPAGVIVCEGSPVTLTVGAAGTGLGYQWRKAGVSISSATADNYALTASTVADGGVYDVIVNGTCGSQISIPVIVTVNPIPVMPTISESGATTFCDGGSVTLTSSAVTGNQWYKGVDAIVGANGQSFVATTSGDYKVQNTQSGCPSAMSTVSTVTVNPKPAVPVITVTGNVLSSSAATENQWFMNGAPIAGATAQTYRVQANGLYTVQTYLGTCNSTSTPFNFVATRVESPDAWNGEISIYPNPVVRTLMVKNVAGRRLQVQLFDAFGKKVREMSLHTTQGGIDVQGLSSGIYQVLITDLTKKETISQTIIKL